MAKYAVQLFPDAAWDADQEQWILGAPSETLLVVEAEYPAAARTAVLGALRLDLRGMRWLPTPEAVCAWDANGSTLALRPVG